MERSKALALLNLDDTATTDAITDALDQAVFKVRDHFLRSAVIPKLAEGRVEKCVQLSDVAQTLGVPALGQPAPIPQTLPHGTDLEALVLGHVENIRRCRNAMATTLDPDSVAQLGHLMSKVQTDYMTAFLQLTSSLVNKAHEGTVPAREEVDWMALLAAVRAAKKGPGSGVLLQDLVAKERARMEAMLTASQPTPR